MIGYRFYWYDDIQGYQFVRTMPERRKDPTRITDESIMNLGRKVFGAHADTGRILVVPITSDIRPTKSFPEAFPNFDGDEEE